MKRGIVLGALILIGALSLGVKAYQPPAADAPKVIEVEKVKDNLYVLRGGGGNTAVFVTADRRRRRRREEPGLGQADPRQDQGADAQAGDDDHQHAHARRSRERQRRVPRDDRLRRAGEHQGEHGEDADLQGTQRRRHAQAHVQGQDDDRQGRRPDRPLLLRPRPHQRRRVGRLPGAARHALGRHLRGQERAADRRATTAAAWMEGAAGREAAGGRRRAADRDQVALLRGLGMRQRVEQRVRVRVARRAAGCPRGRPTRRRGPRRRSRRGRRSTRARRGRA